VLDGDPAPSPKRGKPLVFIPCLLWSNGWMDEDATCTEVDLGSGHIMLDGNPASPRERGTAAPPSLRPMYIVATVANLSYC